MVRVTELQASLLSSSLWEQDDCEECRICDLYWPSNDACGWHLLSVVGRRFAYCLMFHLGKNLGSDSISSSDCSWTLQNSGLGEVYVLTWDKYNPGFGACCCCMSLYCPETNGETVSVIPLRRGLHCWDCFLASLLSVCASRKDLNDFSAVLWILTISQIHNAKCCKEV